MKGAGRRRPSHKKERVLRLPLAVGPLSIWLLEFARKRAAGLIHLTDSEERAAELKRVLGALAPQLPVIHLPAWDNLPYDRAPPSREVTGQRVVALRRLADPALRHTVLISTPDALLQRVIARAKNATAPIELIRGSPISVEHLQVRLESIGYIVDDRVDEPGEVAFRGKAIDIFPAGEGSPIRIDYDGLTILALRRYDPLSQLSETEVEEVSVYPMFEFAQSGEEGLRSTSHSAEGLATVFEYLPDATLICEASAEKRRTIALQQIADAREWQEQDR